MSTVVEEHTYEDMSGDHTCVLLKDPWSVQMYDGEEFNWEVNGKVVGYLNDDPNREIREPFTEETAREEFMRWRR